MFTVYQIQPTKAERDRVNAEGWAVLQENSMERMRAKQDMQLHGAEAYEPWMKKYYYAVATVDADSLNEVFHLTNLWNEPERVNKMSDRMHSVSVGDMIFDGKNFHIVDDYGFTKLEAA